MSFVTDIAKFIWSRKKWWLVPAIIILIFLGLAIVFAGGSAFAPFIYTLF